MYAASFIALYNFVSPILFSKQMADRRASICRQASTTLCAGAGPGIPVQMVDSQIVA